MRKCPLHAQKVQKCLFPGIGVLIAGEQVSELGEDNVPSKQPRWVCRARGEGVRQGEEERNVSRGMRKQVES